MSRLETAALPIVRPLIIGDQFLLDGIGQLLLAGMLALVSCRIELTARGMRAVPPHEIDFLRANLLPSCNWRIWIARHDGANLKDYVQRYAAMQIGDEPLAVVGPEYCNTQVTTLIVGHLYAHLFFSTVWPNFGGYAGIKLTQLWPPTGYNIETAALPSIGDETGVDVHETIARLGRSGTL
jgi:hypothetical protein